mgnify:CR=1 FL=1
MSLHNLSAIILYCFHQFNGERSPSAIYHLLKGKKSSQTIQDAQLYQVAFVYSMVNSFTRKELDQIVAEFMERGLINRITDDRYVLTVIGKRVLNEQLKDELFPAHLNGFQFGEKAVIFWKRLSLIIQVLSNLIHDRAKFIPIHRDERLYKWVKLYLLKKKQSRIELAKMLHDECRRCLSDLSSVEATIFTLRLTSYDRIGMTNEQIASYLGEDKTRVQLQFWGVLHYFMKHIQKHSRDFPILYEMFEDLQEDSSLTISTRKTYQLVSQGKSIYEIAKIRSLKTNTIEDHIVELAFSIPDFSIAPFITMQKQQKILSQIKLQKTNKLKLIKESLGGEASYFEIRLVLAKCGGGNAS